MKKQITNLKRQGISMLWMLCLIFSSQMATAQDNCASATPLPVAATCMNTLANNIGATFSGDALATCGVFDSENTDTWFSMVVPSDGNLDIEVSTAGGPTDWAMSAWSGTCGALTEIECDDDDGPGLFPLLNLTGLTAGQTIYLQIWEWGTTGSAEGEFNICAVGTPPVALSPPSIPIDFGDAMVDYNLEDFGGTSSVLGADPTDPANQVLCITKPPGSECWAGTTIGAGPTCLASPIPFAAGMTTINVDVYSPVAGAPVLLKVENCANGVISSEILAFTTAANTWETLSFDLSMGCPNPVDFAQTYDKISVFPNFTCGVDACGVANPGAGSMFSNSAFYVDNIMLAPPPPPAPPTLPINFDDIVDYNLEDFGGTSSVLGADPTDPANQVLCVTKPPGSECWAGTTIGAGPTCLDAPIPFAAGATTIDIDVYSPVAGAPVLLKVENCANGGIASEILAFTTAVNTWETLSFDLSMGCPNPVDFAQTYDKISVFPNFTCDPDLCGVANPGAGSMFSTDAFYFDNIMLATAPSTDVTCTGNVPIENLANGMDYTIVSDAMGNVTVTLTVVDNPAGLVGFFGGPGGIFQVADGTGTFVYTFTGQTVGAPFVVDMFFNWAAGGQGNSDTVTVTVNGPCMAADTDVVFCVDFTCFPNPPVNPSVFGTFNGFNPTANPVTDPDGDGIYCATVTLPPGNYEFLFFEMNEGAETFAGGESCTVTNFGFTNRDLVVGGMSPQMENYGWEDCGLNCITPVAAPEIPITFEDPAVDYNLVDFGGTTSVIGADPTDPSNPVLCITKPPGSQCWAGTTIGDDPTCLQNPINFTPGNMVLSMDVYSPVAGAPILLKVENCINGGISSEVLAFTTGVNTWETLSFDFSMGCGAPVNLGQTYDQISVFPNFTCTPDACGVPNPGAGSMFSTSAFYVDNIMFCDQSLAPVITCPVDVTISCDASTAPADTGMATATDLCSVPTVTFADVSTQGTGCDAYNYTITRTWTATDNIGTTAVCTQVITVQDITPPMIVCPADVTTSCDMPTTTGATGMATATDNCSSAAEVTVTFSDASTQETGTGCGANEFTITRTWTATDACGNTATCDQIIGVADTEGPMITCPPNQTLDCDTDPLPIATTIDEFIALGGTAGDNCGDVSDLTLTVADNPPAQSMLDFCPTSPVADRTLTRTYTVTDACGNSSTCEQLFIYNPSTNGPIITSIPLDQTVDCAVNAFPQPALFIAEGDCSGITYSVSGPSSSGTTGCPGSTIRYTYTAMDVCGRMATHTQTYTLINEGPEFVCPTDICVIECPADNDMIQAQFDDYANLATVLTSCSETSITIGNNFNPNNFISQNCANPVVAVPGAVEYQVVTFTATDACGRNGTCTALVVLKDSDGPVMDNSIPVGLADCSDANLQGDYTAWATSQLNNLTATDECSGGDVTFSYSPLTANVDCSSGLASTEVSFIGTDPCGNQTIETSFYRIIDNGTGEPVAATVSGNLLTEEDEMVALANVEVDGFMNTQMLTNDDGYYHFDLMMAQNYSIFPSRNDDPLNGITTYDLIVLGQHLLEINLLDSPYKMIAADVNESGHISAVDMIELRRLILLIDDEFSSGKSWTFVDAAYVFPNPSNPFATTYPTSANINNLASSQVIDFIGVKLGDLNASATVNALQAGDTRSSDGTLKIKLEDQALKAGQTYDLAFKASDFKDVSGFQFTLDFAADYLEFVDFQGSELNRMSSDNFGFTKVNQGKIAVSWNEDQQVSLADDESVFQFSFTALQDGQLSDLLSINGSMIATEAYQADLRKDVELDFGNTSMIAKEFTLLQNTPNPFRQETVIGFQLPEAVDATLTIFDVAGRVVWSQKNAYDAGQHQVMMDKGDLGATGVFYYQLSTEKHTATKKMIILK